jgi:5-hydroxyisourate hydrolase
MSGITTHVLDLASGRPAAGVAVALEVRRGSDGWERLGAGVTDDDGRARDLVAAEALGPGVHRMVFATGDYFDGAGVQGFYPEVTVVFTLTDPAQHHHIPLLLSPFGYSTYRGS